jgi:hypothetical protein
MKCGCTYYIDGGLTWREAGWLERCGYHKRMLENGK